MAKKKSASVKILSDAQLAKKYPSSGRASIIALSDDQVLRLPTRFIALNHQLNGGLPYGKILELFGEESTGKSLLAMDFASVCQALGGIVIWDDAENAFNKSWFIKNGIDLDNLYLMEDNAMERIADWSQDTIMAARSRLTNNEPILLVVDSLATIRTIGEVGESMLDAKAKYGLRAKAISDFLGSRNQLFAKMGVCVILINQLRKKIGATQWEDPDKTVGGDATKFYAAQRVGLVRGKQIKKKIKGFEIKVGQNVYCKTKKDKTGPPRSTSSGQVYFRKTSTNDVGFDKYTGLPELLVSLGVVNRKKGSSIFYFEDKMVGRGEESFLEALKTNNELRKKLIQKSKINTISRTKQQIKALNKNLYPVKLAKNDGD
jgi:recombination protein RecA